MKPAILTEYFRLSELIDLFLFDNSETVRPIREISQYCLRLKKRWTLRSNSAMLVILKHYRCKIELLECLSIGWAFSRLFNSPVVEFNEISSFSPEKLKPNIISLSSLLELITSFVVIRVSGIHGTH